MTKPDFLFLKANLPGEWKVFGINGVDLKMLEGWGKFAYLKALAPPKCTKK